VSVGAAAAGARGDGVGFGALEDDGTVGGVSTGGTSRGAGVRLGDGNVASTSELGAGVRLGAGNVASTSELAAGDCAATARGARSVTSANAMGISRGFIRGSRGPAPAFANADGKITHSRAPSQKFPRSPAAERFPLRVSAASSASNHPIPHGIRPDHRRRGRK
jgi:hypothetical protein